MNNNFKNAQRSYDNRVPEYFWDDLNHEEEGEMDSIKEDLQELIGLVYELNRDDLNRDWQMNFSGHVDSVSVHYSPVGGDDIIFVEQLISTDNLQPLIEKVREYSNNLKKSE